MLQKASVDSVIVLAKKIGEAGLSMIPHQNTPLSIAVNETYSPAIDSASCDNLYFLANELHTCSKREAAPGVFPHDDVMETLVGMASAAVQKNILLARTVVNPQVKQVVDAVEQELERANLQATNPIAVVPDNFSGVWASPTLTSLVDRYTEVPVRDIDLPNFFPAKTPDEILALLKSGSSHFDSEVNGWAESIGVEFFNEAYSAIFEKTMIDGSSPVYGRLHDYISSLRDTNPVAARNRALTVFLLARNLKEEAPEEAGVDLNTFREVLTDNMEQAGRAVAQFISRRMQEVDNKLLISTWPTSDSASALFNGTVITVNGDTYQKWVEEGGSPEVILGSFMTDRETGYQALLENANRYKTEWERVQLMRRSQLNSQRFNIILQTVGRAVSAIINELPEEELVVVSRSPLHARLREKMSTLSSSDFQALYPTVRSVLTYTLYAHTDAERILKSMDEILDQMPKLDVREAALYAIIDVVTSWVMSLIEVKPETINAERTTGIRAGAALVTMANAVELATQTVLNVAGNDIGGFIDGKPANYEQVTEAVAQKLQSKVQYLLP